MTPTIPARASDQGPLDQEPIMDYSDLLGIACDHIRTAYRHLSDNPIEDGKLRNIFLDEAVKLIQRAMALNDPSVAMGDPETLEFLRQSMREQ